MKKLLSFQEMDPKSVKISWVTKEMLKAVFLIQKPSKQTNKDCVNFNFHAQLNSITTSFCPIAPRYTHERNIWSWEKQKRSQ
jgi:hypothetical protein